MDREIELQKLGDRIKEVRKSRNLTQVDLSSLMNKDQQSIQRIESGRINPSYLVLKQVCQGLGVTLEELLKDL